MFRNRWVRRLGVTSLVLGTLVVVGWFYVRHKSSQQGLERITLVESQLDATDPRWRLDDIDADRGNLPDDENGVLLIPRLKAALAPGGINPARPDKSDAFEKIDQNRQLDDKGAEAIDQALRPNDAALAVAREFRNYPRGLRRYQVSPDVIGTLLPDVQEHRTAVQILSLEAERLARDGRHGAALQLIPAMLNVGRGMDGEPFLISALVRIACDAVAVRRLERTLALGVPRGGLADVQVSLLKEAEGDVFWGPLRGERALMDRLFTNLRTGVVPPSAALVLGGPLSSTRPTTVQARLMDWTYQPFLANDHAVCLETFTQMYAVRVVPEPQQRAALNAVPIPEAGLGTQITRLLLPAVDKLHDASLRHRAMMRCAGAALAVERFRLQNDRWPDSLTELPVDLLRTIPLDPFDGLPLKYAKRPDGVTVYSVGFDATDNGGNVTNNPSKEPGADLGFRLYNFEQRGQPAIERPRAMPDTEKNGLSIRGKGLEHPGDLPDVDDEAPAGRGVRTAGPQSPAQIFPAPREVGRPEK
jgi:hypothetical protein